MKKIAKLVTLALACVLMIGVIVGVTVSAENADTTGISIRGKNVAYNAATQLCVAVDGVNEDNKDSVAMLFWDYNPGSNPTAESATSKQIGADKLGDKYYFLSYGVDAKDMSAKIYFAPALVEDGEIAQIGTVSAGYSIVDYAIQRLTEQDASATQANLYQKLLTYAGAAETMFGNKEIDFALITAQNGYVGKYDATVIGAHTGDTVLLRAEANNAAGEYFLYWEKNGEKYSDKRVTETAPAENGKAVYTAVYGDKPASIKKDFIFENAAASQIDANNRVKFDFGQKSLVATNANRIFNASATITNNSVLGSLDLKCSEAEWGAPYSTTEFDGAEAYTIGSTTYYVDPTEKQVYTAKDATYFLLDENYKTGDVDLKLVKGPADDNGMQASFWNGDTSVTSFEYDVCWESNMPSTETQLAISIRKSGSTTSITMANLNLSLENNGHIKVYTNGGTGSKKIGDITYTCGGTLGYINYNPGETLTLGFEARFDKSLPELYIYANGQLAIIAGTTMTGANTAKHPLAGFQGVYEYDKNSSYFLRGLTHFQLRAVNHTQTIDNAAFYTELSYHSDLVYNFETGHNDVTPSGKIDSTSIVVDPFNPANNVLAYVPNRTPANENGTNVKLPLASAADKDFAITFDLMIPSQDKNSNGIYNEYNGDFFTGNGNNPDLFQVIPQVNGDYFTNFKGTVQKNSDGIATGYKLSLSTSTSSKESGYTIKLVTDDLNNDKIFEFDKWYSISLVIKSEDGKTGTVDLFIDGEYTVSCPIRNRDTNDFSKQIVMCISTLMRSVGNVYYDNIGFSDDVSGFVVPAN